MFRVLNCLTTQHDWRLVMAAGALCLLSSFTAITLFNRARSTTGQPRAFWIVAAGAAGGCGIWATHFLAMLAYDPGLPIAYDIKLTILSLLAAVALTTVGLAVGIFFPTRWGAPLGGAIIGTGIACMHYMGVSAVEFPGRIAWDVPLVIVSIVMGVVLGMAALAVAVRWQGPRPLLAAAFLLAAAIVSHHFTAMGAVEIIPDPTRTFTPLALSPGLLAIAVASVAVAILGISLISAVVDRRLDDKGRQFGTALNNMHHGLLMFDRDNRAAVINRTYIEMYRLSPEQAKPGCTMRELLEQRAANGTLAGDIDDYIENMTVKGHGVDMIFDTPDGRSIRVLNKPMGDGGWVSVHEDITQQRKAEAEIREYAQREQLFIAAVESSNDAIVTKSLDGVITGWNAAAERLFGYTSQEAIGKRIDIIVPTELRDEVRGILSKIRNGEKVDNHETVRINKAGRRIDVSLSVSPVKSQSGAIIGAAKVARDISATKKAQAALLESEQMARAIIDTALDAFIQLDASGTVIGWSPKAEEMFGWSDHEIVGQKLEEFIIPEPNRAAYADRIAQFISDAQHGVLGRRYEAPSLRRDGTAFEHRSLADRAPPPRGLHRQWVYQGHHREDCGRRALSAGPKDGIRRPIDRRGSTRLQQHAHRHHRHD